jgi:hypothetical protein
MDPLTILNLALTINQQLLSFEEKIWDAAPPEKKTAVAGDVLDFIHNIAGGIINIQNKINGVIKTA